MIDHRSNSRLRLAVADAFYNEGRETQAIS